MISERKSALAFWATLAIGTIFALAIKNAPTRPEFEERRETSKENEVAPPATLALPDTPPPIAFVLPAPPLMPALRKELRAVHPSVGKRAEPEVPRPESEKLGVERPLMPDRAKPSEPDTIKQAPRRLYEHQGAMQAIRSRRRGADDKKTAISATPDIRRTGRSLLRQAEKGRGPEVDVLWPSSPTNSGRLQDVLSRCFGMKTILRAGHAKFYAAGGARGVPMRFDTVRYSSVGRLVSRTASEGERREVDAIRKHHSVDGSIYRILPRSLDAALFGGLDRLVPNLDKARSIEVAYRLEGRQLLVDLISIDGNRAAGTISLGAFRSECAGNP